MIYTLNNDGDATETYTYANSSYNSTLGQIEAGDLRGWTHTDYDNLDRAYETDVYNVDPSTGAVGAYAATDNWYDADGNLIATQTGSDGAFHKIRLRRPRRSC